MDDHIMVPSSDTKTEEVLGSAFSEPGRLFQGVDAFKGKGKLDAVTGSISKGNSETEVEYKITTSIAEFARAIDVSIEMSVEKLFGTASLDAKAKFANQLELTDRSVVVLVNYKHSMQHSALDTTLRESITPPPTPLNKTKLLQFFDNYGNKYVTEISKGGQYIAAYVFRSTTFDEQNKIVAELNGKGIYAGGEIQASTIVAINSVRKESSVEVTFNQTQIGYSGIALPKEESEIPKFISETLPAQERPDAILSYFCNDYFEVPGLTRAMFRSGSVCLNSRVWFYKWIPTLVMPPPVLATVH